MIEKNNKYLPDFVKHQFLKFYIMNIYIFWRQIWDSSIQNK